MCTKFYWQINKLEKVEKKKKMLNKMCATLHHLTFWPQDDLWPHHTQHHRSNITQELFVEGLNKIDQEIKKWEQVEQKTNIFSKKMMRMAI